MPVEWMPELQAAGWAASVWVCCSVLSAFVVGCAAGLYVGRVTRKGAGDETD